ncbi:uncharacterized protein LOC62_03G003963 [Vanrija pseudolonga]|uniref:Uncharacterized protein n=1 Tax=Vanrija pseudolonga TaxID=143232 RepID=A0AAF1BL63_9TREE|nr:hypothetical protein LOC62_03G003963 [Vanrija pseudolonga]
MLAPRPATTTTTKTTKTASTALDKVATTSTADPALLPPPTHQHHPTRLALTAKGVRPDHTAAISAPGQPKGQVAATRTHKPTNPHPTTQARPMRLLFLVFMAITAIAVASRHEARQRPQRVRISQRPGVGKVYLDHHGQLRAGCTKARCRHLGLVTTDGGRRLNNSFTGFALLYQYAAFDDSPPHSPTGATHRCPHRAPHPPLL